MKIRNLGPVALLCVSILSMPMIASAGGTITGVVIDGFTGQPVRSATLAIDGTDISFATGVGGDFRGEAPAGTYTITVSKDGFESQKITGVAVDRGRQRRLRGRAAAADRDGLLRGRGHRRGARHGGPEGGRRRERGAAHRRRRGTRREPR